MKSDEKYEKQIYMAMLAEQCGRYQDMMKYLEEMVLSKTDDLTADERNLLSIAYKNNITLNREAIKTIMSYEDKELKKTESTHINWIREYKVITQRHLERLCNKICKTIDDKMLPKAETPEAYVFYLKMKGDYFRYIAENVEGDLKSKYTNLGLQCYTEAEEKAKELDIKNKIKLGFILNFSVFYYEVVGDKEKACKLVKDAIEQAQDLLNSEELDDETNDSISILNLLRENYESWTEEE